MPERFHNGSPGAMTLNQARELEINRARERKRQAAALAAQGRGDDTEIAHVARGEVVIPEALQTPELLNVLRRAAKAQGIPLERFRVGSRGNSINPNTGVSEFGLLDDIGRAYDGARNTYSKYFGGSDPNLPQPVGTLSPDPNINERTIPPTYAELGFDPNGPKLGNAVLHDPVAGVVAGVTGLVTRQQAINRFGGGVKTPIDDAGDSWRHSGWNQWTKDFVGPARTKKITDAYERTYTQNDEGARIQDLYNNMVGRILPAGSDPEIAIKEGYLRTRPFK